jgi:hypothetical protein
LSDFDSPWKEVLDVYFELFLAFFFPQAHVDIDWQRGYQSLDKELQKIQPEGELGTRVVDKLVQVWLKSGQEEWLLIHIEIQTQAERNFPLRVYIYNYRLFDRYNQKVVSLAVLADDREDWRPNSYGYDLWGFQVGIRFPVVKLLDYAREEALLEQNPNPFATLVLAHVKTLETRGEPESRRAWKLRLVISLYHRGFSSHDIRQMFRFIDWVMDLPKELEESFWQEYQQFEEEKHMPYITSVERIGMEKGLKQGLEQGLEQGQEKGLKEAIALDLESRFGTTGLELLREIEPLHDMDLLRKILRALKTTPTLEELQQVWKNR